MAAIEAAALGVTRLHRVDALVKLALALLACAALATAPRAAPLAAALVALPALLGLALARPPLFIVGAAFAVAAPFTAVFVLAAPFLEPGAPVARFELAGLTLTITDRGLALAATLAIKLAGAVCAVLALVTTTPATRIAHALARLRLPRFFTSVLLLTWRYLAVVMGEARRMLRARRCRAPGRRLRPREAARLLAVLLGRALARADRIHRAMLARGWAGGDLPSLEVAHLRRADAAWGLTGGALIAGLWLLARAATAAVTAAGGAP
jgi:cobalt/nickel transport system permease protein